MPENKNYLNGAVIKEHAFDNGGTVLKVWIKVDEFSEQLKSIEKNGSANIVIQKRKEPSEKGVTHYIVEDTYKPKDSDQHESRYGSEEEKDDLPF
tara:strand:- start:938 stop:1222 length:285 start_codon:yes stop_codon:yes gene_type:complete